MQEDEYSRSFHMSPHPEYEHPRVNYVEFLKSFKRVLSPNIVLFSPSLKRSLSLYDLMMIVIWIIFSRHYELLWIILFQQL